MDSDQEDEVPNVNFVPSLLFVKRGVAKANPDKITLAPEELARIINEAREDLDNDGVDNMDTSDDEENEESNDSLEQTALSVNNHSTDSQRADEYNLETYDQESANSGLHLSTVAVVDPTENFQDEEDSDAEDEIIKPTDNLILVGHVQNDSASMEVYILNEEEGSLYVHHEFLLPSPPLSIEWLSFDPGSDKPGNVCAIGCMDPVITLWDLDIQDSLEPICKLGSKGNRKKNIPRMGHSDAVLDLSWNNYLPHILASGSVDRTVILWDLEEGIPHTTLRQFEEKVQALAFHPSQAETLLAGSCDGKAYVFDCRSTTDEISSYKSWSLGAEVERVCWDRFNERHFVASTNDGCIHYVDIRREDRTLWKKQVHEKETTGLVLSSMVKGMLTTASADGTLKVWDLNEQDACLVYKKNPKIGVIQCLAECPENPFTLALGGDLKSRNFCVLNLLDNDGVSNMFKPRFDGAQSSSNIVSSAFETMEESANQDVDVDLE
ncbi:periodic tryptophan protein 1 homolog [Anopheles ziemanni]|uniref:periodic tryptophan protein 1 homolog n=1 Tax=Anopheles coustani TaxID=139045 RepID=UPI00265992AE|nr:periodic tryptophan protein 1 homolog [Anopheles coustani]XP_058174531.1 periodic tryptophan protein 1 homolog [Anopheles ziemanni]